MQEIIKIDWEAHSVVLQLLLPSTKVFLRGILTAEMDYLQDQETGTVLHDKINIPWNKVVEVNWLYPPELSSSQQKEYMFRDRNYVEGQLHYESIKSYSDPIHFDINEQHSVWAYELFLKNQARTIEFQGTITLKIQLFQNQLVNLNKEPCRPL